jgi:AcrR family transcriptional regulator
MEVSFFDHMVDIRKLSEGQFFSTAQSEKGAVMPKIVDHDAERERIAEAAASVFRERGYSAVSLREIAQAAGVSKSALYHYFPTKLAMFEAASRAAIFSKPGPGGYATAADWASSLEPVFEQELRLVLDFLKQCGADASARELLIESVRRLQHEIQRIEDLDTNRSDETLCRVVGWLCLRLLDPDFDPTGDCLSD